MRQKFQLTISISSVNLSSVAVYRWCSTYKKKNHQENFFKIFVLKKRNKSNANKKKNQQNKNKLQKKIYFYIAINTGDFLKYCLGDCNNNAKTLLLHVQSAHAQVVIDLLL